MPERPRTAIDRRFWEFHAANPEVYRLLVQYARQAKRAGKGRVGVKMLMERLRWYVVVETRGRDGYKLNNDYSSRYARLLMQQEPDLAGLFDVRELRTTSSLGE